VKHKDKEDLMEYLNDWLGIWGELNLKHRFIPTGKEYNFKTAKKYSDLLGDLLVEEYFRKG